MINVIINIDISTTIILYSIDFKISALRSVYAFDKKYLAVFRIGMRGMDNTEPRMTSGNGPANYPA